MRRWTAAACAAAALLLADARPASAHAGLVSSTPAAGDTLRQPPPRLVLRFTEPVEASSSGLVLLTPDGRALTLAPQRDPSDVNALVAGLPPLGPGGYRVQWRTLSADGHPVDGSFVFFVSGPGGTAGPAPAERPESPAAPAAVRAAAAVLRGLGVGALAALGGLLLFSLWLGAAADARGLRQSALVLAAAAALLLAAHAVAWAAYARGAEGGEALTDLLVTTLPGRVELARVALALLALWALGLAARPGLALAFAAAAVAASGLTGHSAAIHPAWTAPAKALHVAALAVWAGGLVALWRTSRGGDGFQALATRVSSWSFAAVAVLVATGVVQTLLFAPLSLLVRSAYGAVLAAKLAGLAVLLGLGARNRYRLVPRLPDPGAGAALRRSVGWELLVMLFVLLAAGVLAYVPVPRPHAVHAHPHAMK